MTLCVTSLCLSTFIQGTPWIFFTFALLNTAIMAIASGYLCTAVYAVTAVLGASFLQIMISGQAAVGVAVSLVQVSSSIISLLGSPSQIASKLVVETDHTNHRAEELAARIFFGVSAIFILSVLVVYTWLTKQPYYQSIISAVEPRYEDGDTAERTGLIAGDRRGPPTASNSHVYQVLKQNLIFMFSIAFVFAVTLASAYFITVVALQLIASLTGDLSCDHGSCAICGSRHSSLAIYRTPFLGFQHWRFCWAVRLLLPSLNRLVR